MRDDSLPPCIYPAEGFSSSGVACRETGRHCESCGWNPEVARERSREISRELKKRDSRGRDIPGTKGRGTKL